MQPPKCRFCGKIEWRHRCMGAAPVIEKSGAKKSRPRKAVKKARAKA